MSGMQGTGGAGATTAGERLLQSAEVVATQELVTLEVQQQVTAALHGPAGTALALSAPGTGLGGLAGREERGAEAAQALLNTEIPHRFIAIGAALTIAYIALADGDDRRTAAALLCAQRLLFPDDPLGVIAVSHVVQAALEGVSSASAPTMETPGETAPDQAQLAAQMQRRVAGEMERVERGCLGAFPQLAAAALSAASWKAATGGAGPGSGVLSSPIGPFVEGLIRWAFDVEAALIGIRRDDWALAGAALIAARRVTSAG